MTTRNCRYIRPGTLRLGNNCPLLLARPRAPRACNHHMRRIRHRPRHSADTAPISTSVSSSRPEKQGAHHRAVTAQARRLLAIAAVLDGASREEAAKAGGMDRQTLRDWVIRFNEEGPEGLINKPSPGAPGKLNDKHKAFLARIVDEGPIPAIHGVVRWRACDLIMRLYEEFGLSVSDDTVYRALKELGFSHVSARPRAYKQSTDAIEAFKKTLPPAWRKSAARSLRVHR